MGYKSIVKSDFRPARDEMNNFYSITVFKNISGKNKQNIIFMFNFIVIREYHV